MKVHLIRCKNGAGTIQWWYDRSTRCWWAAKFDLEGNQVGDAEHRASRPEILSLVNWAASL